jgi:hypothetical protein
MSVRSIEISKEFKQKSLIIKSMKKIPLKISMGFLLFKLDLLDQNLMV